jgi:hypothetical protein
MNTAAMNPVFVDTTTTSAASAPAAGATHGVPRLLLRLEGAVVLAVALSAYAHLGGRWGWFAALFLVPDLSLLGYLANARVGAVAYNAAHSYVGPALLALAAFALGAPSLLLGVAIWVAHVGFDRMLGYGLKYATAFGDTHLGRVGRKS